MLGTIRAVEEELQVNGLVHRYVASRAPDGLPGQEATFLACSFWLADAYALAGRWNDARNLFERLLLLLNDVGLLAEEYDPVMCRMAGNFPHAGAVPYRALTRPCSWISMQVNACAFNGSESSGTGWRIRPDTSKPYVMGPSTSWTRKPQIDCVAS